MRPKVRFLDDTLIEHIKAIRKVVDNYIKKI